jgi:hypothetical protein
MFFLKTYLILTNDVLPIMYIVLALPNDGSADGCICLTKSRRNFLVVFGSRCARNWSAVLVCICVVSEARHRFGISPVIWSDKGEAEPTGEASMPLEGPVSP